MSVMEATPGIPSVQTLSSGLTTAQKYGVGWAYTGAVPPADPLSGVTGIIKYGGSGGSYFVQSIPGALILNADLTPAVHHPLRASMWPLVLGNKAVEMDPNAPGDFSRAREVRVEWDNMSQNDSTPAGIMEKVGLLVELAKAKAPRPSAVVIDTVETVLSCIQPWIGAKFGKDFLDLGEAGWMRRKAQFWDRLFWPLRYAGYPIILVMQLYSDAKEVLGPDGRGRVTKDYPNTPKMSVSFSKELRDACNVVAKVESYERATGRLIAIPGGGNKGEVLQCYRMVFRRQDLGDLVKCRVGLPDEIDITGADPWNKYATAYTAAAKSDIDKANSLK
jgi:hypothetical protein